VRGGLLCGAIGLVLMSGPALAQERQLFLGTSHLLTNVTIIDGRGGPPRPESAILVWGGKIQAIGPRARIVVPQGTTVVDLGGSFVVPGFIDAHASPRSLEDLRAMLAAGVTAVREASLPLGVFQEHGRSTPGDDPVPTVFVGAPALDAGPNAVGLVIDSEEAALAAVERQVADGVPFVSVGPGLPGAWIVGVVRAARRGDTPVWADREGDGWLLSVRAGAAVVSRLISGDPELLPEEVRADYTAVVETASTRAPWLERLVPDGSAVDRAVSAILSSDVPLVPLLAAAEAPLACIGVNDQTEQNDQTERNAETEQNAETEACESAIPPDELEALRKAWPAAEALVQALRSEGVRLLVGSDSPTRTPAGKGFHREMELLVQAGIPTLEVLSMATRDGAIAIGQLHDRGTLEVGKRADFLVLDGDPVADIQNASKIGLVFLDGDPWRLRPDGRWETVRFR